MQNSFEENCNCLWLPTCIASDESLDLGKHGLDEKACLCLTGLNIQVSASLPNFNTKKSVAISKQVRW